MKTIANLILLSTLTWGSSCAQLVPASTNLSNISLSGNPEPDVVYVAHVSSQVFPWTISTQLTPYHGVFLRSSRLNPFFNADDVLAPSTLVFTNSSETYDVPFTRYLAIRDEETGMWRFQDGGLKVGAGHRTEAFFGIRFTIEGAVHHGWLRFTRPDAQPETLFTVAGHEWNPVPNAPIQVGWPPEILVETEVLPNRTGIRLTWPPGASHWILENARSLTPPIVWEPYPSSGGSYADVPPEDAERYFRLKRPE